MNNNPNLVKVSSKLIKHYIYNLHQLVFEVTGACNLKCTYCAFSEYYNCNYERQCNPMSFHMAKIMIDYLVDIWKENSSPAFPIRLAIGFYGGEPLLNFSLIKEIVEYINSINNTNRRIQFHLTTNATLLDKYIEFFIQYDFSLLVSLDGDEYSQSFRLDHYGNNSFNKVFNTLKWIQKKYPEYFIKKINFNSVLHSRNDIGTIYDFFKVNFNKSPKISSLSKDGINKEKKYEFDCIYNEYYESFLKSHNRTQIEQDDLLLSPMAYTFFNRFEGESGNSFYDYNDLIFEKRKIGVIPTGTCIPFSKKMFITTSGKILQCEKIDQSNYLGCIKDDEVIIDTETIALRFNKMIFKFANQCKTCAFLYMCNKCLYRLEGLNDGENCEGYISKNIYPDINLDLLINNPSLLNKIYEIKMMK